MVSDIYAIAAEMRKDDIVECELATGSSPEEALRRGFNVSDECFTVEYREDPVLMFGRLAEETTAIIWMLGTHRLDEIRRPFVRASRPMIQALAQGFDYLHNAVWEHNYTHLRWLGWCGAQFSNPIELPSGAHFVPFKIYSDV